MSADHPGKAPGGEHGDQHRQSPNQSQARGKMRPTPPEVGLDPGGTLDEPTVSPDLQSFARWFADWWLRRGHELTTTEHADGR